MGLDDEYNVDGVDVEDTEAYREAVRAGSEGINLEQAYRMWWETAREPDIEEAYAAAVGHATTLRYDTEELYDFCADTSLEGDDGLFISAAANAVDADTVQLPELSDVDRVGYQNTTTLHINGDVGDRCGEKMHDGRIRIQGDAGEDTGRNMHGGSLTIEGDVGSYCGRGMAGGAIEVDGDATGSTNHTGEEMARVGQAMTGGRITIKGDGGGWIGQYMNDGLIHVKGDAGSRVGHSMEGGEVKVEGETGSDTGFSMRGGTLEVGSTAHTVGIRSTGGTIVVGRPHPDAGAGPDARWPLPPTDAQGVRVLYGTGPSQRQAWPPQSLADWGEHAARTIEEVLDELFGEV